MKTYVVGQVPSGYAPLPPENVLINGALEFTVSDARNLAASTSIILGGNYLGSQYYAGWLDEVRITKGVARYTANFTPDTVPFNP